MIHVVPAVSASVTPSHCRFMKPTTRLSEKELSEFSDCMIPHIFREAVSFSKVVFFSSSELK